MLTVNFNTKKMKILNFDFSSLLGTVFLGNSVQKYLIALGIFLGIYVGILIFKKYILSRLKEITKKTKNDFDDKILEIIEKISSLFYLFLAVYFGVKTLELNPVFLKYLDRIFMLVLIFEVIKITQMVVNFAFQKLQTSKNKTAIYGLKVISNMVIWTVAILLILDNFGFEIKTLVASFGIGGIAIALAAQNILSDLFSSFTIYFDRPFEIGDYIVLGTDRGTVKKIGLKTTRIKTIQGEELVVSNKELTTARVQNFKKMKNRRSSFQIGVEYETSTAKVKKIPQLIQEIIESQGEKVEFSRCHFSTFGPSALLFDIVYFVNSGEYSEFMEIQQKINLAIKEAFEKEKISMAFPTQTVIVKPV